MNAIKNKIQSDRGASITFALLLFLVCAILSSVIIVAATTAAGRMSGMRETDQRYYAAIGAAKSLQEVFDGAQVDVSYDHNTKARETATITVSKGDNIDLLKDFSFYAATGLDYTDAEEITIEDSDESNYKCTIKPKLIGGLLTCTISADGGTENINKGTYNLEIVFASNVKNPKLGNDTTMDTATVSWSLHSLRKVRATMATGKDGE